MGQLAVDWKFLSKSDIFKILRQGNPGELFGETARRTGMLTEYQLMVLLGNQALCDVKIGKYFLEQGVLDERRLAAALHELRRHNFLVSRQSAA